MASSVNLMRLGARVFGVGMAVTLGVLVAAPPSLAWGGRGYGHAAPMKAIPVVKLVLVVKEIPVTKVVLVPVRVPVVKRVPVVRRVPTFRPVRVTRRAATIPRATILSRPTCPKPNPRPDVCFCDNTKPIPRNEADCQSASGIRLADRSHPDTGWWKMPATSAVSARVPAQHHRITAGRLTAPTPRKVVTYRKVVVFKTVWLRHPITVFKLVTVLKPVVVTKYLPLSTSHCSCKCTCGYRK